MPRPALDEQQLARGRRLARALADAREQRQLSQGQLAYAAHVPVDTLRRIEQQHVAAPSFFLVAALARPLDLSLDDLAQTAEGE